MLLETVWKRTRNFKCQERPLFPRNVPFFLLFPIHLINTNENKYGDKHFGTSFRDNGPFGSLPLYDDYSEESDS